MKTGTTCLDLITNFLFIRYQFITTNTNQQEQNSLLAIIYKTLGLLAFGFFCISLIILGIVTLDIVKTVM